MNNQDENSESSLNPTEDESEAERFNAEGLAHWQANRHEEAFAAFRTAAVVAREEGFSDEDCVAIDSNLATAAIVTDHFAEAYDATGRILTFQDANVPEAPEERIDTCIVLCDLAMRQGRSREALVHGRRAWRLCSSSRRHAQSDATALRVPRASARFGIGLASSGVHQRAIRVLERARREYAVVNGSSDTGHFDTLEWLARLYRERGDTSSARLAACDLVAASRATHGSNHVSTVLALNICGSRCFDDRRLEDAIVHFREATDLAPVVGLRPGERAGFWANLAKTYLELDRLKEAADALDAAEGLLDEHGLRDHPDAIGVLMARTHWQRRQRRFFDAEQSTKHAIAIAESRFGRNAAQLATPLTFLGGLLLEQGRTKEAEAAYVRIVHLDNLSELRRASALHNVGNLRLTEHDLTGAREASEASLAIKLRYGDDHGRLAATLANLGAIERDSGNRPAALELLQRALKLEERDYGRASPQSTLTLNNLAGTLAGDGQLEAALDVLATVLASQRSRLGDIIRLNDDARRIDLLGDMRHELDAYVGVASMILPHKAELTATVYREVIRRKGLLTTALTMDVGRTRDHEAPLAQFAMAVGAADAIPTLPANTVVLDFIGYGTAHLTLGPDPSVVLPDTRRYGVFIVHSSVDVRFIDLGTAETIEGAIEGAMRAVRGGGTNAEARTNGQELRRLIWVPLDLEANDLEQAVIVPDGAINDVSFAALPGERPKAWLGDDLVFSYATSVLELIEPSTQDDSLPGDPLVLSDPAYPMDGALAWTRLTGTRIEGDIVARHLGCTGCAFHEATIAHLRSTASPRVLHIAAHGFYWPLNPMPPGSLPARIRAILSDPDPLGRSGLALAPERDANGSVLHDGLISARDILRFDLSRTALAVMSACDTGLGHHEPLDGAHGLRRALRAAGVATVVASLWKVDDATTPALMEKFYQHLTIEPPHRALALAAREIASASRTRHPSHWAAFICFGRLGRPMPALQTMS